MRPVRTRRQASNVSLFPFLAVLICTMGSLIVLLVIVVQQARIEAQVVSDTSVADDEQIIESEDVGWRLGILQTARNEQTDELASERLRLAGLEEHIRQLEDQVRQLSRDSKVLFDPLQTQQQNETAKEAELDRMKQAIAVEQHELDRVKRKVESHVPSFSIVPYSGSQGTMRRPIFIECRADSVILQPEGIVLTEHDFLGPQGPGNALAAALRATREYLTTTAAGEPYPLLVVRPRGSHAYAAARGAMKSWEDEFGYELIADEIKLEYPPPDPALAKLLERTVQQARQRRQFLARAAPSHYGGMDGHGYVASRSGGFVPIGEPDSDEDSPGWGGGGDLGVDPSQRGSGPASETVNRGAPDQSAGADGTKDGDPFGQDSMERYRVDANAPDFGSFGQSDDRRRGPDPTTAGAPGDPSESDTGEPRGPSGDATQGAGGASSSGNTSPISATKGKDWGLRKPSRNAIGLMRPIRVACFTDRLVILPEKGQAAAPQVVPVDGSTHGAIESFVSAIWNHVDRWGIPGQGSYWNPVLYMEVAPGGETRFAELQSLLQSSGIKLQRSTP